MFEERLIDFIQFLGFEKRYSQNTLTAYQKDLEQFRDYLVTECGSNDLKMVSHFQVRGWLAGMKTDRQADRTINRKLSSLNSYFAYLIRLGYTDKNPVRLLHSRRLSERLPSYLKESETTYLLDEVAFEPGFRGSTDRLICELLYATGFRRNELLQLKETDLEWSLKQIRVLGKGNKERLLPVPAALLDAIRDYIQEKKKLGLHNNEFLLNLESGEPLYAGYVYRVVTKYLGQATTMKKKSPHVLRHTFATHLLNNGANIQAIKDLLGHSSLATTQVYTHNNIDKLKEIHKQNHPRG